MKDKIVVITGGNSGIGKALAFEFGNNGSKVVITGRNLQTLQETEKELIAKNIDVLAIQADVTLMEDNQRMVAQTLERFGKIDVLINNAGMSMRAYFEDVEVKVIEQLMNINFFGAIYATKCCLPYIIKQKGSVIGISSIAGFRGLPARVGYSASKFALQGFLEGLRVEMMDKGVHVLTASPYYTTSNIRFRSLTKDGSIQNDSPRDEKDMMSAEECARLIYKATIKRKKILILTFMGKLTVFLNKLFPEFMDKMVLNFIKKEGKPK
ncbi:MAG: SDR family oxidoreductase [Thermoflexibacter sp.]|jgi:short-subunit dehydrogenase|nr:SDR family oxidoreductase [Thermoflexibacter sp.]